MVEDITFQRVW